MKSLFLPLAICAIALSSCSPTDYEVKREITIDAPTDVVFGLVNNHKQRDAWSPWEAMDPNMNKTYEGPESGVGAIYKWTGNDSVGTGWMEILESQPNIYIKSKLVFTDPFESESIISWNFSNEEDGVKAIWTITGQLPGYLFWMDEADMESQMAPDFERGLANLKRIAEERAGQMATQQKLEAELVTTESHPYYYIYNKTPISNVDNEYFSERYEKIFNYLGEDAQNNMIGAPFAIYSLWDEENDMAEISVALACQSNKPKTDEINKGTTYSGEALKCKYTGPYETSGEAHEFLYKYADENGYEIVGNPWEVYITGPANESDANKWVTEIYYPVSKS